MSVFETQYVEQMKADNHDIKNILKREDVTYDMISPYIHPLSQASLNYIHMHHTIEIPPEDRLTDHENMKIMQLMIEGVQ